MEVNISGNWYSRVHLDYFQFSGYLFEIFLQFSQNSPKGIQNFTQNLDQSYELKIYTK